MHGDDRTVAVYKWLTRDRQDWQEGIKTATPGPALTPYFLTRNQLAQHAARSGVGTQQGFTPQDGYAPGTELRLRPSQLRQWSVERWRMARFDLPGYVWSKPHRLVEEYLSTNATATFRSLFEFIAGTQPLVKIYPHSWYATKSVPAQILNRRAAILFDYWANTHSRYDVVEAGFDWGLMDERKQHGGPLDIPIGKARTKLARLPRLPPRKRRGHAAGTSGGSTHAARIEHSSAEDDLRRHVRALRQLLDKWWKHDLPQAQREFEEAHKVIALLAAARAIVEVTDRTPNTASGSIRSDAQALHERVLKNVTAWDRFNFTLTAINNMLLSDGEFAQALSTFAAVSKSRNQAGHPLIDETYACLIEALHATDEHLSFRDDKMVGTAWVEGRLHEIADGKLETPPTSVLQMALQLKDVVIRGAPSTFGNFHGPQTLQIAVYSAAAKWTVKRVMATGLKGGGVTFNAVAEKMLKWLQPRMSDKSVALLRRARNGDPTPLANNAKTVEDEITGTVGITGRVRVGVTCIQWYLFICSCRQVLDAPPGTSIADHIILYCNVGLSGVASFTTSAELAIHYNIVQLGCPRTALVWSEGLATANKAFGIAGCVLAVFVEGYRLCDALVRHDWSGALHAGVGVVAAALCMWGMWTGNATVIIIGTAMAVGVPVVLFVLSLSGPESMTLTAPAMMVVRLLDEVRQMPFYQTIVIEDGVVARSISPDGSSSIKDLMERVNSFAQNRGIPLAPWDEPSVKALAHAGFRRPMILAMCDRPTAILTDQLQVHEELWLANVPA